MKPEDLDTIRTSMLRRTPLNQDRIDKGLALVLAGKVTRLPSLGRTTVYLVEGTGRWPAPEYTVAAGSSASCDCPDRTRRGARCKHIVAAAAFEMALRRGLVR